MEPHRDEHVDCECGQATDGLTRCPRCGHMQKGP